MTTRNSNVTTDKLYASGSMSELQHITWKTVTMNTTNGNLITQVQL